MRKIVKLDQVVANQIIKLTLILCDCHNYLLDNKYKAITKVNAILQLNKFNYFRLISKEYYLCGATLLFISYNLLNCYNISLNKFIFFAFNILGFGYLLLSGFTYFQKLYKYNRFTTLISEFWYRSFNLF